VKILGLLRHAKSDWDDLGLRDFDRGLNQRGRRGAQAIGNHIRQSGWHFDRAIASPAERVRRTIAAGGFDCDPRFDERLYLADAATLMAVLAEQEGNPERILLAGHNPGLQELVFRLVDPARENDLFAAATEKYPTATFALLELDIDVWADISPGCGVLAEFARPRDLDPELGPEEVR
jgi:phosphohistidine phosphatase